MSVVAVSCTQVGDHWVLGTGASAAKDQMMLVRSEPPSFGYQRLIGHSQTYPDIEIFLSTHGIPDFLAETGTHQRNYFILYYLSKRQAFACRNRDSGSKAVEFAGPYPITDREFKLLDGFRRNTSQRPITF